MPRTNVRAHARKGTKGVRGHSRKNSQKKVVPKRKNIPTGKEIVEAGHLVHYTRNSFQFIPNRKPWAETDDWDLMNGSKKESVIKELKAEIRKRTGRKRIAKMDISKTPADTWSINL